jgi:hypothetical protein
MRIWLSFFLLLAVVCIAACRARGTEGGAASRDGCLASNNDRMKFQTRTSYAMAVLSTLVYCMPIQPQSFRVVQRARPTGRMRRLLCQTRRFFQRLLWRKITFRRRPVPRRETCPRSLRRRASAVYRLQYWFKDWREPTIVPGIRYHDTDLLMATTRDDTILVFSGSASPTNHATNLQTCEKIAHAGIFPGQRGSLHRGFLNAYSRVDHGILYSYTNSSSTFRRKQNEVLLPMFRNCTSTHGEATKRRDDWAGSSVNGTGIDSAATRQFDLVFRRGKKGGCLVKGTRLRHILVLAVQNALIKGKHVHITGHSLGTFGFYVTLAHNSMLISLSRRRPCYPAGSRHNHQL